MKSEARMRLSIETTSEAPFLGELGELGGHRADLEATHKANRGVLRPNGDPPLRGGAECEVLALRKGLSLIYRRLAP